ncbi:phosphatidylserine decarboxylase proenzyme, mitochondrial-like isoform X2 [Mya arenaria]|uniref:phosphatidylserine decarboxylase proenzyme, mitochondrial-like isoform X2 n=1 Tax=Mya arenaria TaxID=6604 RepID=UPI0022E1F89C|nr:phosphatidylserine decarboxylase proenzyme, mitochondrial-like isoform X2 [Mya arenaria]
MQFRPILAQCVMCRCQFRTPYVRTNTWSVQKRLWSEKTGYMGARKNKLEIFAGILMVGGPFAYFYCANPIDSKIIYNTQVGLYRAMPLKAMSRVWGKMTCWDLPLSLRKPLLGLYCRTFHVNLDEALDGDLQNYQNLSELFRRELKPGVRVVDKESQMTSPADGRILNYGKVQNGVVEQVKGVNYSIKGFLGPMPSENEEISTKPQSDTDYHDRLGIKPGHDLYHCIIYLAPGDYHRFHSPSDWTVTQRRHFPGELLSVNPSVARWIQGLFNLNERVVYSGSWKHGFYSYTAVGATNVGSIKVYFDEDLSTNAGKPHPSHIFYDKTFSDSVPVSQGEMVGEFNLGSTIVLLFEAPSDFKFNLNTGQKVQFGQSLGGFK